MRLLFLLPALLVLGIACSGDDSSSGGPATGTPTPAFTGCRPFAPLSPDTHTIRIRKAAGTTASIITTLVDTASERAVGLSDATCLPKDSGMLFAFPEDTNITFTMRDTEIPLSIAFILETGEIVHMLEMEPHSMETYASPVPFRYAIEAAQGWFAQNGVAVGDVAEIDPVFSQRATN
jgi:uncharacterized membrane protein (UPF0127 family)